jgi:hypothetical protein
MMVHLPSHEASDLNPIAKRGSHLQLSLFLTSSAPTTTYQDNRTTTTMVAVSTILSFALIGLAAANPIAVENEQAGQPYRHKGLGVHIVRKTTCAPGHEDHHVSRSKKLLNGSAVLML